MTWRTGPRRAGRTGSSATTARASTRGCSPPAVPRLAAASLPRSRASAPAADRRADRAAARPRSTAAACRRSRRRCAKPPCSHAHAAADPRGDACAARARRRLARLHRHRADALRDGWIAKGGAEGLFCAAHEDGRGIALKAEDGALARSRLRSRASWTSPSCVTSRPQQPRRSRRARSREGVHRQRHGRRRRDRQVAAGDRRPCDVRGGPPALHRRDQRGGPWRKAAGATEIVVMDCHGAGEGWTFNSLIPEELDPDCEYVVQDHWTEYTEYLRDGVDAALFVGMHAMAGTRDGVLAHTVSGWSSWRSASTASRSGETGINAALCGAWSCPVLLVTGDEASCREAGRLLGDGLTTGSGQEGHRPVQRPAAAGPKAREVVEAGARSALADLYAVPPYDPGSPLRSSSTSTRRSTSRSIAPAGVGSRARGRSVPGPRTGGRPGGSSSCRPGLERLKVARAGADTGFVLPKSSLRVALLAASLLVGLGAFAGRAPATAPQGATRSGPHLIAHDEIAPALARAPV